MGASCKGICVGTKITNIPNSKKYQFGLKRCTWCEVWVDTREVRCTCCKMILRTRSRNKKKTSSKSNTERFGGTAMAAA